MKRLWKASFYIIIAIAVMLSFSACRNAEPPVEEKNSIVGTWQDSYGLTKYTFFHNGKMKIKVLNIGSFNGNYDMHDDHITIEYSIPLKKERNTYSYKLKDNKLYLDGKAFIKRGNK